MTRYPQARGPHAPSRRPARARRRRRGRPPDGHTAPRGLAARDRRLRRRAGPARVRAHDPLRLPAHRPARAPTCPTTGTPSPAPAAAPPRRARSATTTPTCSPPARPRCTASRRRTPPTSARPSTACTCRSRCSATTTVRAHARAWTCRRSRPPAGRCCAGSRWSCATASSRRSSTPCSRPTRHAAEVLAWLVRTPGSSARAAP